MADTILPADSFTFVSRAHGTTSWLDHCVTTHTGQGILYDFICSTHLPMIVTLNCSFNVLHVRFVEPTHIRSRTHTH